VSHLYFPFYLQSSHENFQNFDQKTTFLHNYSRKTSFLLAIFIPTVSMLVFHSSFRFALRLEMKRIAFALPLTFITPVCLAFSIPICNINYSIINNSTTNLFQMVKDNLNCGSSIGEDPSRFLYKLVFLL
jgi:hypothetical protein